MRRTDVKEMQKVQGGQGSSPQNVKDMLMKDSFYEAWPGLASWIYAASFV